MADQDRDDVHTAETDPPPARGKKAYVKPAFESERVFETMALACGKVNTTQIQCRLNKKLS